MFKARTARSRFIRLLTAPCAGVRACPNKSIQRIDLTAARPEGPMTRRVQIEDDSHIQPAFPGPDIADGIEHYIHKKFTSDAKVAKRESLLPNADWQYKLVLAELKDESEIGLLEQRGIDVIRYSEVIAQLESAKSQVNSTAGSIVEILRYVRKQESRD